MQKLDTDFATKTIILQSGDSKSVSEILDEFSFECAISKDRYFKKGAGQEWEEVKLGDSHTLFFRKGADKSRQHAYVQVGQEGGCVGLTSWNTHSKFRNTCPLNRDVTDLYNPFLATFETFGGNDLEIEKQAIAIGEIFEHLEHDLGDDDPVIRWYSLYAEKNCIDSMLRLSDYYKSNNNEQKAAEWSAKAEKHQEDPSYILSL
ncbi:hypothetical protein DID78_05690 [Candidatus Marinamargulisbacteria bacterium SCGC AG-343-D04]|nr:hypothetical protein DID78_05690 [Candidatus Marinamargulisbacteria bacterium SCGC AG-343-D04]